MLKEIRPAVVLLALLSALTGLAYPLAVTAVAHVAAPSLAEGSLVTRDDKVVGSALIGQNFASPRYFHGRPSATTDTDPNDASKTVDAPYEAANSSGSNLGPTSAKLAERVKGAVAAWRQAGGQGPAPADAVTTSASGLDPDISPANALAQVPGVAKARAIPEADLRALVDAQTAHPLLGFLGQPRVNVLALNLALDTVQGGKSAEATRTP